MNYMIKTVLITTLMASSVLHAKPVTNSKTTTKNQKCFLVKNKKIVSQASCKVTINKSKFKKNHLEDSSIIKMKKNTFKINVIRNKKTGVYEKILLNNKLAEDKMHDETFDGFPANCCWEYTCLETPKLTICTERGDSLY